MPPNRALLKCEIYLNKNKAEKTKEDQESRNTLMLSGPHPDAGAESATARTPAWGSFF